MEHLERVYLGDEAFVEFINSCLVITIETDDGTNEYVKLDRTLALILMNYIKLTILKRLW